MATQTKAQIANTAQITKEDQITKRTYELLQAGQTAYWATPRDKRTGLPPTWEDCNKAAKAELDPPKSATPAPDPKSAAPSPSPSSSSKSTSSIKSPSGSDSTKSPSGSDTQPES